MKPAAAPADRYAAEVVRELMAMRWSRARAINAVQGDERYVRQQFSRGTPPAFAAGVLARKVRRTRGQEIVGLARGTAGSSDHAGFVAGYSFGAVKGRGGDVGPAGLHALKAPLRSSGFGSRVGLATGSTACNVDPSWQPAIFGEDLSDDALEALAASSIGSADMFRAFRDALGSVEKVHQYNRGAGANKVSRMRFPAALYVESTGNTKVIGGPNYVARRKQDHRFAAATYASISSSCPDECKLRDNGCYAQQGKTSLTIIRLDKEAQEFGMNSLATAASEAYSIYTSHGKGKSSGGGTVMATRAKNRGYLRVHVGGDSQTVPGTHLLANAVHDWMRRGGEKAWSYTHAWRKVPRSAWGPVSVLASLDDPNTETMPARAQGYVPAVVVSSFGPMTSVIPNGRRPLLNRKGEVKLDPKTKEPVTEQAYRVDDYELFQMEYEARRAHVKPGNVGFSPLASTVNRSLHFPGDKSGTTYVPCPAQVEEFALSLEEFKSGLDPKLGKKAGKGCLDCRLCFNDNEILRPNNLGIMFEAHGPKSKEAMEALDEARAGTGATKKSRRSLPVVGTGAKKKRKPRAPRTTGED